MTGANAFRPGCLWAGLALASALTAQASDTIPPPPQTQPILVTGATLHTVSGPVLVGGRMLIERGRITAIVAAGEPLPPQSGSAQVVDLGGRHVYPGFIAANSAIGLTEISAVRATVDHAEVGALNPNARAVVAVNADSDLLPVARANGVLAALVVPGGGQRGLIAGTSALMQLDGWNWEEMAVERETALHVVLPSMRLTPQALEPLPATIQVELRKFTEERLRQIDDAFDAAAAYLRARTGAPDSPADQRWEAMLPVLQGRRPVFVHADELPQIRHALGLAERHRLKLVIVGGADAWRITELLRERRVPVVIGGVNELPLRRDEDVDARFRLPALLAQAGVTFCIAREGGIFAAPNERNLPYEAATAAAHGLPRDEALKAITLYPAQILGVADRLGSLAPGRLASFIVTDGDPLETTTRVERVFIQGREVSTANRQTRLTDKYEQRYRQLDPR
ncbi:amidohydrolase family protein [uncultured Piscinibacter sp.]|uniref:amidohydrolase family protein n=1 Tax=uncultured Piscinibacter sp. TaxID=1131835 RepID=UPI00260BB52E|nr:amidohydrolase family protein [uncultured Piscinibacter sp.]